MTQQFDDWNEITGIVRKLNYLKVNLNPREEKSLRMTLTYALAHYFQTYQVPYNPAEPWGEER